MRRYQNQTPRWIEARFASTGRCGHKIQRGQRVFYYPSTKSVYCQACGYSHAAELANDDFDQVVMGIIDDTPYNSR